MNYYTSVIVIILLALGVLSVLISENNRISRHKKQHFLTTNLLIALAAIAECAGVHISGKAYIPWGVLAAVKAIDYTLTPMIGGALITLMQKSNVKNRLIHGLFAANAILQAVSAFQGWMVVIDDRNYYTHGPLYPLYMVLYCMVIITAAATMLSYGKSFRKQNRKSLYATVALIFTGIGMQELFGQEYRVAYLAATFGSAFLFIHYSEFYQLQLDDKITEQQVKLLNDPMTGVLSRFAYMDAVSVFSEKLPEDLAVFLIDVNGLKSVNDLIGHEAGDALICGAAHCIEASVGKSGKTFRIGGDEFVVFAAMTQEQADAALADLTRKTESWKGSRGCKLSVSAGYALARDYAGFTIEALVKEADKAMYEQKQQYYRLNGRERRSSKTPR